MTPRDILRQASQDVMSCLGDPEPAIYDDGSGSTREIAVLFREDGAAIDALGVAIEDRAPTAWVGGYSLPNPRAGATLTLADRRVYRVAEIDRGGVGMTKLRLHFAGNV